MNALLSVSDKTGIIELASALHQLGIQLISTGGTAKARRALAARQALADWLRGLWRRGRIVGGLCTGAYALARAGIMKDKILPAGMDPMEAAERVLVERVLALRDARRPGCLVAKLRCAGDAGPVTDRAGRLVGARAVDRRLLPAFAHAQMAGGVLRHHDAVIHQQT